MRRHLLHLVIALLASRAYAISDDTVLVHNGTTYQSKAITSCSTSSSAVTYNTTTNVWGCNTTVAASTATALAANPTDCGVNTFAHTIDAEGDLTCSTVADGALASNYSGVGACGAGSAVTATVDNAAPTCDANVAFDDEANTFTLAQIIDASLTVNDDLTFGTGSVVNIKTALSAAGDNVRIYTDANASGDRSVSIGSRVDAAAGTTLLAVCDGCDGVGGTQEFHLSVQAAEGLLIGATGAPIADSYAGSASLDFAGVTDACESLTITVTGAAVNDTCVVGPPAALPSTNSWITCFVSSAGTATVRHCAHGASGDPAGATYTVRVFDP